MKTVKRSVVARGRDGRIKRRNTEDLGDSKTTLYNTIMLDTSHYIFAKVHTMYNTNNEP